MKKYLFCLSSLLALGLSDQSQATKIKFRFTPQGSICQITDQEDFLNGNVKLFDSKGECVEEWNLEMGDYFRSGLLHPEESSMVALDASENLARFDRQQYKDSKINGQILHTASHVNYGAYLNLLTYSPKGDKLYFAEIYPRGTSPLSLEDIKQNLQLSDNMSKIIESNKEYLNRADDPIIQWDLWEVQLEKLNAQFQEEAPFLQRLQLENFFEQQAELMTLQHEIKARGTEYLEKAISNNQIYEDAAKQLIEKNPNPFTDIHIIDPQDGTPFETIRLPVAAITHGQFSGKGHYLVLDNRHPIQKHGTYLIILDLVKKTQTTFQLSGEHEEAHTFRKVRVRGDNVYFLTYSGKDNVYNRVVQYNIPQKKLSVAYETNQDIVNYFLSVDGKFGYTLLNSLHGFDLQALVATEDGHFKEAGQRQRETFCRNIRFSPKDDAMLVRSETWEDNTIVKRISFCMVSPGPTNHLSTTPMLYDSDSPYDVETFMAKNTENEREIPAIYYSQPAVNSERALIVSLHGGPHAHASPQYSEEVHSLLNQGYNFLEINYGGSTGFGKRFANLIDGDYGGEECTDILAAITTTCKQDKGIDQRNIFITGSSYGAYLTVLLGMKHPDLAKGLVAASGIYDWSMEPDFLKKAKDIVSEEEYMMRLEPYKFVHKLKSPLLLIHGTFDDICPVEESKKLMNAAVKAGKPVTFYTHDTGHFYGEWWVNRVAKNQAINFLDSLRNGTAQQPLYKPALNPSRYQEEELTSLGIL